MHWSYFSAILDFNTEYGDSFVFHSLPEVLLEIISENFGEPICGGKCSVPLEKHNLVFSLGVPYFQYSHYHQFYFQRGLVPKLKQKPTFAYLAAIFDIYGNITEHYIGFTDPRISDYLYDVFRRPVGSRSFRLVQKSEVVFTVNDIQKYLLVRRDEYLNYVKMKYGKNNYGKKENDN